MDSGGSSLAHGAPRARRCAPFALVALANSACVAPEPTIDCPGDAVVPIPLRAYPVLTARVEGGGNVELLVDTGASHSVLDVSAPKELGLDVRSYWIPRHGQFTNGPQVIWRHATIERLELGRIR